MTAFETMANLDVDEKEEAKRHKISELVGLSIQNDGLHEGDGVDEIKEDEATQFAAYLTTEIDNKGKQLAGKPNLVKFTPDFEYVKDFLSEVSVVYSLGSGRPVNKDEWLGPSLCSYKH